MVSGYAVAAVEYTGIGVVYKTVVGNGVVVTVVIVVVVVVLSVLGEGPYTVCGTNFACSAACGSPGDGNACTGESALTIAVPVTLGVTLLIAAVAAAGTGTVLYVAGTEVVAGPTGATVANETVTIVVVVVDVVG